MLRENRISEVIFFNSVWMFTKNKQHTMVTVCFPLPFLLLCFGFKVSIDRPPLFTESLLMHIFSAFYTSHKTHLHSITWLLSAIGIDTINNHFWVNDSAVKSLSAPGSVWQWWKRGTEMNAPIYSSLFWQCRCWRRIFSCATSHSTFNSGCRCINIHKRLCTSGYGGKTGFRFFLLAVLRRSEVSFQTFRAAALKLGETRCLCSRALQ